MIKRHVDKFRRHICLRRACYGLLLLAIAAIIALLGIHSINSNAPSYRFVLDLSMSTLPYNFQQKPKFPTSHVEAYIEDVIRFDSEVLVSVRTPSSVELPSKKTLGCRYGGAYTTVLAMHRLSDTRAAVVCVAPPEQLTWDVESITIQVDQDQEIHSLAKSLPPKQPLQWNSTQVTYEALSTDHDLVVFVHGINHPRPHHLPAISEQERLQQFQCVFGGEFEVPVTAQAQEIFRCPHPPGESAHRYAGRKISIKFNGNVLPSVAYYNPLERKPEESQQLAPLASVGRKLPESSRNSSSEGAKKHHVCSCTMIYNGTKFLKEWVYYHAHLGVEKFFLYDNNSEDDLDEVVASLERFNVSKVSWPWLKTQEAGFSHCSLIAAPECTWMLFTDIDEYFFPNKRFLENGGSKDVAPSPAPETSVARSRSSSILGDFIKEVSRKAEGEVGQISAFCLSFGPSGLTVSPPQGVTQGYTCRLKKRERHKSIVLLSSIDDSLANVVHQFSLKRGYETKQVRAWMAVINHYKFQAWDEFKTKFHRRAATYVADWTEERNHGSRDRVQDLGTRPIKPANWESRYCAVQDYGLRNYILQVFGWYDEDRKRMYLPWE